MPPINQMVSFLSFNAPSALAQLQEKWPQYRELLQPVVSAVPAVSFVRPGVAPAVLPTSVNEIGSAVLPTEGIDIGRIDITELVAELAREEANQLPKPAPTDMAGRRKERPPKPTPPTENPEETALRFRSELARITLGEAASQCAKAVDVLQSRLRLIQRFTLGAKIFTVVASSTLLALILDVIPRQTTVVIINAVLVLVGSLLPIFENFFNRPPPGYQGTSFDFYKKLVEEGFRAKQLQDELNSWKKFNTPKKRLLEIIDQANTLAYTLSTILQIAAAR